jgi:hypothetical protein
VTALIWVKRSAATIASTRYANPADALCNGSISDFDDKRPASLHRNLEGRLYRGTVGEKGFQLSRIVPFEIGV